MNRPQQNSRLTLLVIACIFGVATTVTAQQPVDQKANRTEETPRAWRKITPDVVYGHKFGMALTYDVIQPTENANGAGVLFMASGGWVSRWFSPEQIVRDKAASKNLFEKIVDRGYTLFIVRHGSSPKFTVPEAVSDVQRSIRHIRSKAAEFGVDPSRIGVCGGSAGGHLALILGTKGEDGRDGPQNLSGVSSRVQAVVAYYPPTDMREFVNNDELKDDFPAIVFIEELADDVSPLLHASPDDAPTLMIHGDQDKLVPLWHSQKMSQAFRENNVENQLIVIEGAAHGFEGQAKEQAESALLDWFDKQLGRDKN